MVETVHGGEVGPAPEVDGLLVRPYMMAERRAPAPPAARVPACRDCPRGITAHGAPTGSAA